ncbi:MAG: hypothetical protein ACOC87_04180 [Candidatus Natronoplasma sp.]
MSKENEENDEYRRLVSEIVDLKPIQYGHRLGRTLSKVGKTTGFIHSQLGELTYQG